MGNNPFPPDIDAIMTEAEVDPRELNRARARVWQKLRVDKRTHASGTRSWFAPALAASSIILAGWFGWQVMQPTIPEMNFVGANKLQAVANKSVLPITKLGYYQTGENYSGRYLSTDNFNAIAIDRGKIDLTFPNKLSTDFYVRTPHVTIKITGTTLRVRVMPRATKVVVSEGSVAIWHDEHKIDLKGGHGYTSGEPVVQSAQAGLTERLEAFRKNQAIQAYADGNAGGPIDLAKAEVDGKSQTEAPGKVQKTKANNVPGGLTGDSNKKLGIGKMTSKGAANPNEPTHLIKLHSGSSYAGILVTEDSTRLVLKLPDGKKRKFYKWNVQAIEKLK